MAKRGATARSLGAACGSSPCSETAAAATAPQGPWRAGPPTPREVPAAGGDRRSAAQAAEGWPPPIASPLQALPADSGSSTPGQRRSVPARPVGAPDPAGFFQLSQRTRPAEALRLATTPAHRRPPPHTSCPHYPPPSPSPQRCSPLLSPPPGEGREGAWQGLDLCSCYPAPRTRSLQEERGPRRCPAAPCLSRPAQLPLSPPPPLGET